MIVAFYTILFLSLTAGIVVSKSLKTINNPVLLLAISFDIPLFINRLKLAEIQVEHWHPFTYVILTVFNLIFIVFPAVYYMFFMHKSRKVLTKREGRISNILNSFTNFEIIIMLIISLITQILINIPNSGFLFPIFNLNEPTLSQLKYHTVSVRYWGFLVVSFWYFAMIFGLHSYFKSRNRWVLFVLFLTFIVPAFRLARIDMFVMLLIIGLMTFENVKLNWKIYLTGVGSMFMFLIIGILLMWIRTNELGWDSESSISQGIGYKVNGGPMDMFAFLYAYFCLSFENLNLFVVNNWEGFNYAYGAFTFRPILVGLLKLHIFYPDFPLHFYFNELRDFVSFYAMVPTCIPEFMVDFGFKLAFIPMMIYAIFGNWLFLQSQKGVYINIIYYAFIPAYVLSSFQNLFISPRFVYVALFIVVAIIYKRLFLKFKK